MAIAIKKTNELSVVEFEPLIEDSQKQDILIVRRFVDNWISKTNCFNQKGEVLLVAKDDDMIVGFCGLNIDPYYPVPGLGRVRHLYVLTSKRRQGIGSKLIKQIILQAKLNFDLLNLRTHNVEADKFYLAQGFQRSYDRPECTHILKLK